MSETFLKRHDHPGPRDAEAAGLRWLAATDGAAVCPVLAVRDDGLLLQRIEEVPPTAQAAEAFGRDLVRTHTAGADRFGAPPPGVDGDTWIAALVLPGTTTTATTGPTTWSTFYAELRVRPYLRAARDAGHLSAADAAVVEAVCDRLVAGDLPGGPSAPARLHGDLWSGNVLWSRDGAVLVDPAAHGGHPETDLAMLALFGLPHLDRVLAAYTEAAATPPGWRRRVPLHQLHPLLVHTVLFGGGYAGQAVRAARETLAL
ncbi:fructosamine kinase family protein [Kineococcus sp. NPDC059986]|uniref:fructosamine kinase family protein n=1 Tax=Kineococcus sp. NPDC059986 TaxID=3155538 RepID=UPI00344D3D81